MFCSIVPTPLILTGRIAFAAALAFWGFQHLQHGSFVTRAMPPWPETLPFRTSGAYVIGTLFILCAIAICIRRQARRAALFVATVVFLGFAFLAVPATFQDVLLGGTWTLAGKALVIVTGALAIAATFPIEPESPTDRLFILLARLAFGAFLIQSGIQHFVWDDFVHTLVPSWIPGGPFWTYLTGIALITFGLGLFLARTARLAAFASGAMIFTWVIIVHIPRALLTVRDTNEATALFEAIAFSGLGLLLAAKTAPQSISPQSTASLPQPVS